MNPHIKRRITDAIVAGTIAAIFVAICAGLIGLVLYGPSPDAQRTVCLQSHTQVVMIPIGCGKGVLCEAPVVTEICDRIGPPPSRTPHRGNQDDE